MVEISFKQFIDYLLEGPKAVYADLLVDKYLYFREEYENANSQTSFYYGDGAVIEYYEQQSGDEVTVFCAICQVEEKSGYFDLVESIRQKIQARRLVVNIQTADIFVNIKDDSLLNNSIETAAFSYVPNHIDFNHENIRPLSNSDECKINQLILSAQDDTAAARGVANSFQYHDWNGNEILLGYFQDESLVGIVSYNYSEAADMALLSNIYINTSFRRKRIARNLILSAMAKYPEKQWCYRTAYRNFASINLAKSCGFQKVGSVLYFSI